MKRILPIAVMAVLFGSGVSAQVSAKSNAPDSPRGIVSAFFEALVSENWRAAAALVHPEALIDFRAQHLEMFDAAERVRKLTESEPFTVPEYPASASVPRCVFEHFAHRAAMEAQKPVDPSTSGFAGVRTIRDLERLEPDEVFARWLETRWSPGAPQTEGKKRVVVHREIVGELPEGDARAYVVYRRYGAVQEPGTIEPADVVIVARKANVWRILPNAEMLEGYGIRGSSQGLRTLPSFK